MKIRLDEIGDEPYTWSTREVLSPEALDRPEVVALGPIAWQGEISRLDDGFLLRAHLAYPQTLACQRCLGEVTEEVAEDVDLFVQRHEPGAEVLERELQDEDLGILVVDDEVLDLGPVLEEQVQLNVPMRPLCREECRGLCPTCGADRNDGDCGCRDEASDPRWAGLAVLRGSLPEAND